MNYCENDGWLLKHAAEGAIVAFIDNPLSSSNEAIMLLLHIGARLINTIDEVHVKLNGQTFSEAKGFDSGAATRRAIVRTAASLSLSNM